MVHCAIIRVPWALLMLRCGYMLELCGTTQVTEFQLDPAAINGPPLSKSMHYHLGNYAPIRKKSWSFPAMVQAATVAFFEGSVLEPPPGGVVNFSVHWHFVDTEKTAKGAFTKMEALLNSQCTGFPRIRGIVGGYYSDHTALVARKAAFMEIPQVAFGAEDPDLSDNYKYRYFMRTCPQNSLTVRAALALAKYLGFSKAALFYSDEDLGRGSASASAYFARLLQIDVQTFSYDPGCDGCAWVGPPPSWATTIANAQEFDAQVNLLFTVSWAHDFDFMQYCKDNGIVGPRFVWIVEEAGLETDYPQWRKGSLRLDSPHAFESALTVVPIDQGPLYNKFWAWWSSLKSRRSAVFDTWIDNEIPGKAFETTSEIAWWKLPYANFMFDATWAMLRALNKLSRDRNSSWSGPELRNELMNSDFEGITGRVKFDERGDRTTTYMIKNYVVNHETNQGRNIEVGTILDTVTLNKSITFFGGSTTAPAEFASCKPGEGVTQSLSCKVCRPGFYSRREKKFGVRMCFPCQPGKYQKQFAKTQCNACGEGKYAPRERHAECDKCSIGKFSTRLGSTACHECNVTYTSSAGSSSEQDCQCPPLALEDGDRCICSAGYYLKLENLTCMPCQAGFYKAQGSADACSSCSPGSIPAESRGYCRDCPAGHYAAPNSSTCSRCPSGKYAKNPSSGACLRCESGFIPLATNEGQTACHAQLSYLSLVAFLLMVIGLAPSLSQLQLVKPEGASTNQVCWKLSARDLRIEDAGFRDGNFMILTHSLHLLSMRGRGSFSIRFFGACRALDHDTFQCRVVGEKLLQLVLLKEAAVSEMAETSQGILRLHPISILLHTGWPCALMLQLPLWVGAALSVASYLSGVEAVSVLCAAIVVAVAWSRLWIRLRTQTSLENRLKAYAADLRRENPSPKESRRGPDRAVTVGQLRNLYAHFQNFIKSRNMYYVEPNIIAHLTRPYKLSFAEVVGAQRVHWFVSHFWGTSFSFTIKSIEKHARQFEEIDSDGDGCVSKDELAKAASPSRTRSHRTPSRTRSHRSPSATACPACESSEPFTHARTDAAGAWKSASYWICTLSNNQYRVAEEVGTKLTDSSFYLTLRSGDCRGTCMVLDENAYPLTRSWCLFELIQTVQLCQAPPSEGAAEFLGILFCTSTGVLNLGKASVDVSLGIGYRLSTLRLEDAQASVTTDKDMIDEIVRTEMGGFEHMNTLMRQELHTSLQAAEESMTQEFEELKDILKENEEEKQRGKRISL